MTERDWRTILPCELRELVARWHEDCKRQSFRFAQVARLLGTHKDGRPLQPRDIFPELADD